MQKFSLLIIIAFFFQNENNENWIHDFKIGSGVRKLKNHISNFDFVKKQYTEKYKISKAKNLVNRGFLFNKFWEIWKNENLNMAGMFIWHFRATIIFHVFTFFHLLTYCLLFCFNFLFNRQPKETSQCCL